MDRLTIRAASVNLPVFPAESVFDLITPGDLTGRMVSHFEFSNTKMRTLEMKNIGLVDGKVRSIRTDAADMARVDIQNVEFSDCELSSLHWAGGEVSRTRFSSCKLLGAKFENVVMKHVVFVDCKMDYATLSRVRAAGPVMFLRCSLREAEFDGCGMTSVLLDKCDLTLTHFGSGRYGGCDLRGNDLSTLRGVPHLRRAVLGSAQLADLALAIAAELEITVDNEP
jgi:uncharacterized protein YjbI with pentapeptide repeats